MPLTLVIIFGSAFIGAAVVLHAAGRSKTASDAMLREYCQLLAQAREKKEEEEEEKEENEGEDQS